MNKTRILILLSVLLLAGGCATTGGGSNQMLCAAAGALVGGGGAAAADGDAEAAVASAAIGAMLGYIACNEGPPKAEPKPEPPPAPPPAPEPEKDSDGDGVVDSRDDCPGTPRGTPVDARGCPEIPNLSGVNFNHDKSTLTDEGMRILDHAAQVINANPAIRVEIVGHTDSSGSDGYNQGLSERRAASARDYLVSKGVSASRLATAGRGESQPVADNDTPEGRAANRRVELTARPL